MLFLLRLCVRRLWCYRGLSAVDATAGAVRLRNTLMQAGSSSSEDSSASHEDHDGNGVNSEDEHGVVVVDVIVQVSSHTQRRKGSI